MTPLFERLIQIKSLFQLPRSAYLDDLTVAISRQASILGASLHPITRQALTKFFIEIESYYSSLVDGHVIALKDVQQVLKKQYTLDPLQRLFQKEYHDYMALQILLNSVLNDSRPDIKICQVDFLNWLCQKAHPQLFEGARLKQTDIFKEDKMVSVWYHFDKAYDPDKLQGLSKIVGFAASHYVLTKIHPFFHNHHEIVRLFSRAYAHKININRDNLWSLSRGLLNYHFNYAATLSKETFPNFSEFTHLCEGFLEMTLDQIDFSGKILDPKNLQKKISNYGDKMAKAGEFNPQIVYLLNAVFFQGEIKKEDVFSITGLDLKAAEVMLSRCIEKGLLKVDELGNTVRFNFSMDTIEYYFPNL